MENNENSNSVYIHNNIAYFNLNNAVASLDSDINGLRKKNNQQNILTLNHASYTSTDGKTYNYR